LTNQEISFGLNPSYFWLIIFLKLLNFKIPIAQDENSCFAGFPQTVFFYKNKNHKVNFSFRMVSPWNVTLLRRLRTGREFGKRKGTREPGSSKEFAMKGILPTGLLRIDKSHYHS